MTPRQKKKSKPVKEHQTIPTQRKTRSSKPTEAPAESPQLETQQASKGKKEKRKARASFPDQPGKQVNAGTPPEPNGDTNSNSVQDHESRPKGAAAKTSPNRKGKPRTAPTRPPENSDSDSIPDDEGEDEGEDELESSDNVTSPAPSEEDTEEPIALSATQLATEYPTPINADVVTLNTRATTSKRAERIVGEVPVPNNSIVDKAQTVMTTAAVPAPTSVLAPGPGNYPHHIPTWTDLVQEENGSYKQTSQHPELNACLSAAVKRANTKLLFVDAFPSLHDRDTWTLDSLRTELSIRRESSHFVDAVAKRVSVDEHYLNCLLSMISGRWSSFRQGIIRAARELLQSDESTYLVRGSSPEAAAAAFALLKKDAFHFGKTSVGAIDTGAPYQRQEVFLALRHFFEGNDSLKDQLPTGAYGTQIPEPMAALAATALEVALIEVARGERLPFSEKLQRERYHPHIGLFNQVKSSENGALKYARLLSEIYKGTMRAISGELPAATPAEPTRESLLDTNSMPV